MHSNTMASKKYKEQRAWNILSYLKQQVIEILWDDNRHEFTSNHLLIPWIQEEAKYQIKKLHLPQEKEDYFIVKIDHIIGEYSEEV